MLDKTYGHMLPDALGRYRLPATSLLAEQGSLLDEGPRRAALLDTPRIEAVDSFGLAFRFSYVFGVGTIVTLRPNGPAVFANGKPHWRRFEVYVWAKPPLRNYLRF